MIQGKVCSRGALWWQSESHRHRLNDCLLYTSKGGQILLCTDGEGWYQEWEQPARKLHPGDVVYIAPEVKHWHGAAADEWFTHIAIEIPAPGASNEWLEPVNDDQYNSLA